MIIGWIKTGKKLYASSAPTPAACLVEDVGSPIESYA
jgi:hypothetical protein